MYVWVEALHCTETYMNTTMQNTVSFISEANSSVYTPGKIILY